MPASPSDQLRRGPSLSDQVYRRLKTSFMLGEIEPGRRFTYRDLADQLGISVTPAREALFKLVAERAFELSPGGAITVPSLSVAACEELWRIRLLLEGHCAELAVPHATPSLVSALKRSHQLMAQAKQTRRLGDAMKHNLDFHFSLYRTAKSPLLLSLIEDIWARSALYIRFFHTHHVEDRTYPTSQGPHIHTTIIRALQASDKARVKHGLERDLLEVRDGILLLLRRNG